MSKNFKTFLYIIVALFATVLFFNIFSGPANGAETSTEETPLIVNLLISWLPMIVITIFYIIFLRMFKQVIKIGERIAVALENKEDNAKSKH